MGTWTINPDDLTATRAGLGVAIGTDVLAPNGSAANLTNMPADLSGDLRNVALGSAADRITLLNGIVDPLTDETDVDTGSSINEIFTSTSGGFYYGTDSIAVAQGTGTATGDMTSGGGLAAAFDGSVNAYDAGAKRNAASGNIGKDWGSGVTKKIAGVVFRTISDGKIDGGVGAQTMAITVERSDNGSDWTQIYSESGISNNSNGQTFTKITGFTNTAAARYVRINFSHDGGAETHVDEVTFHEEALPNVTLISNAYTATSAPSAAVLGFQTVENEAATINTDIKGFVSRDGGSNFTEVTLVLKTTLGQTGTKYYESAETTLTSTSGSSMVWKITTHNSKDIEIHGVALSWS